MDPSVAHLLTVSVEGAGGDVVTLGPYPVRAAIASEAVAILEAADVLTGTDRASSAVHGRRSEAWSALSSALRSWLPARLWTVLLSRSMARQTVLRVAMNILTHGIPEAMLHKHKAEAEAVRGRAEALGWSRIEADMAAVYGGSPLMWSWPVFCSRLVYLDAIRARAEMSMAIGAGVGFSGKGFDALQRRLLMDGTDEGMSDAEQIEKLEKWMGKFGESGMGVA